MTVAALLFLLFAATPAEARLDLARASVERLDNGLTLIMLEDRTFPVVSVHTAYRTGAKDDPAGRLGLAHFFEHMAFRGSKNFPDLGLTGEIYAAGGEWHGYTWIDSTNYFATAPKDQLPLLLDIDADRMARLELREEDIEAERGAVLAEMNGYANDPDSTLFDALMAAHFMTHPYRNNTIGYASDIAAITHEDVVDFYERNYAPQNAVIAIVGDFDREAARALVRKKFVKIKKTVQPRAPATTEMPRTGERRVTISLPSDDKLFKIAYPAPAASHPDFPAFLVLQAMIGESAGVNFNQNDWGTPVGAGSPIAGAATNVRSWVIPTAESYAFVISGSAASNADEARTEKIIQSAFDTLARDAPPATALEAAKHEILTALVFDVETTEDAAHQLAYFASIGALDQFLTLDGKLAAVSAEDMARVAAKYLRTDQRTIAWLEPGPAPETPALMMSSETSARDGATVTSAPADAPRTIALENRPPVFFRQSGFSPTVAVAALIDGRFACDHCANDEVAFGKTSVRAEFPIEGFRAGFASLLNEINKAMPIEANLSSGDPVERLETYFESQSHPAPSAAAERIVAVIAVSGAADEKIVRDAAAHALASNRAYRPGSSITVPQGEIEIAIDTAPAQDAVGYIKPAPPAEDALPTRIALYLLSHGYAGRLGNEAISRRGLAYYIEARYRPAPVGGLVTLAAGVDPEKVDAFRDLMKAEIARLKTEPPTDAEIAEAKRHFLGRKISAAQSNEEIAEALIRDFLAVGRPESADEFAARLEKVTRADVMNAVDALQKGAVVTVRGAGVE